MSSRETTILSYAVFWPHVLAMEYTAAGAIVLSSRTQVISDCDILMCVTPPSELVQCSPSLKGKFVVAWIGEILRRKLTCSMLLNEALLPYPYRKSYKY